MASREVELWRSFVDMFTTIGDGVERVWVMERASYPPSETFQDVNSFLSELTVPQREILTKMLLHSRESGIFDTLVVLHDRLALSEGRYLEGGVEMAFEPHGYKLYEDYIRRRAGDPWVYARNA